MKRDCRSKPLWWSLAGLFLLFSPSHAQQDCLTFDTAGVNHCAQWFMSVSYCNWIATPPAGHPSPAMRFTDEAGGPSIATNASPFFAGNWLQKAQQGCLCFDWMIDLRYPSSPPPTFKNPKIGIWTGTAPPPVTNVTNALRAGLVALPNAPDMQEDQWYRICLPIGPCVGGKLPTDGRFTWLLSNLPPGMDTCTAWNMLIANVTGMYLGIDYHSSPSEQVYFDNFCFRCTQDPALSGLCQELWPRVQQRLDSACCTIQWQVPSLGGAFAVASLQYFVSGGLVDTFYATGCPYTTSPSNLHNTVSGTLTFSPPCTNALTLFSEITPTTASGAATVQICARLQDIRSGQIVECCDTVAIRCPRAPITRCDSLAVAPFIWTGLNLSGRTFTVHNLKQPASSIREVRIQLVPDPNPGNPTFKWNGGGLLVDGGPRPWGVANSGTPYYSQIGMWCPPQGQAPQGPAANTTVQFNLGVDYTLNWTGSVLLTVIHCDGDTCQLAYDNWCAKPNPKQCLIAAPIPVKGVEPIPPTVRSAYLVEAQIDTALVPGTGDLHACQASIVPMAKNWRVIGANVDDRLTREERESGRYHQWSGDTRVSDGWAIVSLTPCKRPTNPIKNPWRLQATMVSNEPTTDTPRVAITFYDQDGNPIVSDTARATTRLTPVSVEITQPSGDQSGILRIIPNPAADEVRVEYRLAQPSDVTVELCDVLGRCHVAAQLGWTPAGVNTFGMSTAELPVGSYTLRLRTADGVLTAPLRVVR